jgi:hypothetical protein
VKHDGSASKANTPTISGKDLSQNKLEKKSHKLKNKARFLSLPGYLLFIFVCVFVFVLLCSFLVCVIFNGIQFVVEALHSLFGTCMCGENVLFKTIMR